MGGEKERESAKGANKERDRQRQTDSACICDLTYAAVMGHAYGITQVRVIHKLPMVRVRNPW